MNQKGFANSIIAIIVGIVVILGSAYVVFGHFGRQSAPDSKLSDQRSEVQLSPAEQPSAPPPKSVLAPSLSRPPQSLSVTPTPSVTKKPLKSDTATPAPIVSSASDNSCANQDTDTNHMDIFDAHAHIMSKVSASEIISEMNKAGVSMLNLYPIDGDNDASSLDAMSQYPGRFIAFVDTPDSPQLGTWLTQGQAFVDFAESQLKTGKFFGIGETNLRYYSGNSYTPPPDIYIPPDNPFWLQLVDLSAKYHVPISFHFVPDDPVANAAFERMLNHNKDATFIWAHLGFNNMPLNRTTLNDYLLRYPNLYFDTAGIQGMHQPPPGANQSNWAVLVDESDNGRLHKDWKQFFETWNARILVASDAGGGNNGVGRWMNYTSDRANDAPPNAIGHWRSLFSYTDHNTARNILSANARVLFLKEQKPPYTFSVASDGKCYQIFVNSDSSVSNLTFDPSTHAITFTVADSNGTTDNAVITIPTALAGGNFTASVDGENVKSRSTSNSTSVIVSLEYAGSIHSIILSASDKR